MSIIEALADWVCHTAKNHSDTAISNTKHSIEDVIACMFAGTKDPASVAVRKAISQWGTGNAKIVGHDSRASPPFAALANGTAAHALDYDDTFLLGASHASAVLVPALLALSEETQCDGNTFIDAYIVGLQLQYYLALGIMRSHGDIGWHSTSTLGCISAAGACARLLGLNGRQIANALSLATSMAGGMKVQFGTTAKPLHAGLAAQHAIQAAKLAESGLAGSLHAIDGHMGLLELCGGPQSTGWTEVIKQLDTHPLAIESQGLMIKRFPCCAATHRAIDCALDLQARHGLKATDIARIETVIGYGHARNLMYVLPETELQARFSMQYCIAAALVGSHLGLSDFTHEAIQRPEVRSMIGSITVRSHEVDHSHRPHQVTITLKDGRQFHDERDLAIGTLAYPLQKADRQKKFFDCCNALPEEHQQRLWNCLQQLEKANALQELSSLL